jgi:hypothetical protein
MALSAAPKRILDNGDLMAWLAPLVSETDVDDVVGDSEELSIPFVVPSGSIPAATTSAGNEKAELLPSTNSQPKPKRVSLEPITYSSIADYPLLIADHALIADDGGGEEKDDEDFDADTLMKMQLIEDDEDLDMFFFVEDDIMDIPDAIAAEEDLVQVEHVSSVDQEDGKYDPRCSEYCPWNCCNLQPTRVGYHETPVGAVAKV